MDFNNARSTIMHIDLNSCFATIEQQANPFLRGKPLAVAAYDAPNGCILAPSIEAKTYGIKTGMRVKDGRALYPNLIVLTPDPPKYRHVHIALRKILKNYTYKFAPKSIDEFVLNFNGFPALRNSGMHEIGKEIKVRIKKEIGEWLTVSVGIGPSRFIAKTAASYKKPDGLVEINKNNFLAVYKTLTLTDLHGINVRNQARLNSVGIRSVMEFYNSPLWKNKAAFASILGYYWYLRLRGYEIDDVEFARRSFGNSVALPSGVPLLPILQKLSEKTGARIRKSGYKTAGINVSLSFKDHSFWHKSEKLNRAIFDSRDIYQNALRIFRACPAKLVERSGVHIIAISCFNLTKQDDFQSDIFIDMDKKRRLVEKIDEINNKWGEFVVAPARTIMAGNYIKDRIAFGGVKEL